MFIIINFKVFFKVFLSFCIDQIEWEMLCQLQFLNRIVLDSNPNLQIASKNLVHHFHL